MPSNFHRSYTASVLLALLLSSGFVIPVLACIWTYGTDLEGRQAKVMGDPPFLKELNPEQIKAEWKKKLASLEAQIKPDSDYKLRSDYAAALIHVGENKKAISILLEVEASNPAEYITAANLGTAYELNGENEKALEWIKKGIERNKQSHYGTEWVHVKILEAKLELAKDPDWLKTHTVLGLNFGTEARPLMPGIPTTGFDGTEYNAETAAHAVQYQLHERLAFVSPPDAIVADLLFDLANTLALTKTVERAKPIYEKSLAFGPARPELVKTRLAFVTDLIKKHGFANSVSNNRLQMLVGVIAVCALLTFSAIVLLRVLKRGKPQPQ